MNKNKNFSQIESRERREKRENLLNMISGDVVRIISGHHGLHLHQVLLHFLYNTSTENTQRDNTLSLYLLKLFTNQS